MVLKSDIWLCCQKLESLLCALTVDNLLNGSLIWALSWPPCFAAVTISKLQFFPCNCRTALSGRPSWCRGIMSCWLWPTALSPFVHCVQCLAKVRLWYSLASPSPEKAKEEPLVLAIGKATEILGQFFCCSGVAFCAVPFRTEPKSYRQAGESSSKLFPVTATCQGISNSYFYSRISWVKSIPFKITALTFEPFRQTASGSTLF